MIWSTAPLPTVIDEILRVAIGPGRPVVLVDRVPGHQISGGRIIESWAEVDALAVFRQIDGLDEIEATPVAG